jgi:putative oxidoreductase
VLRKLALWKPYVLSIVRMVFGLMFFLHGCQLWGWIVPPGVPVHSTPPPGVSATVEAVLHVLAGTFAIGGGTLLMIGLFTPIVAFVLSGEMAVAYFLSHAPLGWCPLFNGGESAVLYCFVFLLFSVTGAGEWSLDRKLLRSRR